MSRQSREITESRAGFLTRLFGCSDKVARQFDSMFEDLGERQQGADSEGPEDDASAASVRAMGDFDSGYDARAQAAARQAM